MFYEDEIFDLGDTNGGYPIRNAASANAPGSFSTDGPCGGVATWGGETGTQFKAAEALTDVTLMINYNGGHKSPDNQFAMRFACSDNGPSESDMLQAPEIQCEVLACPVAGQYPCPAEGGDDPYTLTTGETFSGYVMKCQIPPSASGTKCTFSFLEQRNWGGCVDIDVGAAVVDGQTVIYTASNHVGQYTYKNKDVFLESSKFPDCCCTPTVGSFDLDKSVGDTEVFVTGSINFTCPDHEVMTWTGIYDFGETLESLELGATSESLLSWQGTTDFGGQNFELLVADLTLYYTNVGSDYPMICDGFIRLDSEDTGASSTGVIANSCPEGYAYEEGVFIAPASSGSSGGGVGAFPFIIVVALILIGVFVFTQSRTKKNQAAGEAGLPSPPKAPFATV